MVCNNCEEWQRSARKPQCLICCYFDKTIYNVRNAPVELVADEDTILTELKAKKYKDGPLFIDILAENKEHYESLNVDCVTTFGLEAIGRFDNDKAVVGFYYFVFKSLAGAKDYISIRGTKEYAITTFEEKFPNTHYFVYSEEEWDTPHRYTKRKPSECYKRWM